VNKTAWIAIGAAAGIPVAVVVAVPIAIMTGTMMNSTDLKGGVVPASSTCGNSATIQTVSINTPKVSGYSKAQVANAAAIVKTGQDLKMPPRAWVVAVATAMQESGLTNLGNLGKHNDHDSLGLFQQRPSTGWGTPAEVTNPVHASTSFYKTLKKVSGWQSMPLTKAAQEVQRSAYPSAYAKWEDDASSLVNKLSGDAAKTPITATSIGMCAKADEVTSAGWVRPVSAPLGDGFHTRGGEHMGIDLIAKRGTPIKAAAAGTVIHMECDRTERGYDCSHDGSPGDWPGGCGWYVDISSSGGVLTRYCHQLRKPLVDVGDKVTAGQVIGVVGSTGHSSGPHLHFEVHVCHGASPTACRASKYATDPVAFMKEHGAPLGTSAKGGEQAA
jgi:murein DD-endopeptidase MepM/ murein hydrolase activator NlpD